MPLLPDLQVAFSRQLGSMVLYSASASSFAWLTYLYMTPYQAVSKAGYILFASSFRALHCN